MPCLLLCRQIDRETQPAVLQGVISRAAASRWLIAYGLNALAVGPSSILGHPTVAIVLKTEQPARFSKWRSAAALVVALTSPHGRVQRCLEA